MRKILFFIFLLINLNLIAQVKVNQNSADGSINVSSAFFDAASSPLWNNLINQGKGLLFPRTDLVTFSSMIHAGPYNIANNPHYFDGLLVFNTTTGVAGIGGDSVFPGFYFYRNITTNPNTGHWISFKGLLGVTGATGATGASGSNGNDGAVGATGASGTNGNDGAVGATGASGTNGNDGAVGATGASGTNGNDGAVGATGASGTNGSAGAVGATGASGTNGSAGAVGATGASGAGIQYWDRAGTDTYLTNTGDNVGIGTSTPQDRLHVNGNILATEANKIGFRYAVGDVGPYTYMKGGAATELGFYNQWTSDPAQKIFSYFGVPGGVSTEVLSILNGGNIGIGTVTPLSNLQVNGIANTSTPRDLIILGRPQTVGSYYAHSAGLALSSTAADLARLDIKLSATNGGSIIVPDATIMTLLANGNVGIGTIDPQTILSIESPFAVQGTLYPMITSQSVGMGANVLTGMYQTADFVSNPSGAGLAFKVYKQNVGLMEAVRIASTGNIGIGTTAPFSLLTVGGTTLQNSAIGFEALVAQAGSRRWRMYNDMYVYGDFDISQSTANNNTTFVSRLYIKNDGSVGIGTSAPTYRFEVAGDIALYTSGAAHRRALSEGSAEDLLVLGMGFNAVGIGTTAPAAVLQLKAGTTAANTAPLKLTSGTNTTTPEAGTIEYNNNLYTSKSNNVRYGIGGILNVNSTAVGSVQIGSPSPPTDLILYTLPANTLDVNNSSIEVTAFGTSANNGNAKTVILYFGATSLTVTLVTDVLNSWCMKAIIIRTSNTTQKIIFENIGSNTSGYVTYTTAAETLSGTIVIKCKGSSVADNDVIQEGMIVKYNPPSP